MHLLVIILDDLQRLPDLLSAWRAIGVRTTLLNSQGGYRVSSWLDRVGLSGIVRLLQGSQVHDQRLLFSIIDSDEALDQAIAAAERVLGGFDRHGSGVLFTVPVGRTLGLGKHNRNTLTPNEAKAPRPPHRLGIDPDTPVSRIEEVLGLKPSLVRRDTPLEGVVTAMLAHPSVNVVAVVNDEDHLVGLIDTASLSEALFFMVFPETFLAELHDRESVMEFVKRSRDARTAGEIMQEPDFVRGTDTLLKAFRVLQRRKLEGIPVVDENNRPTGYIHLIELMEICSQAEPPGPG